ncbi:MAG: cell division ATP-binding protein FtsE [Pseudomonadota bacterium]
MIELINVSKRYADTGDALSNISLSIASGELLFVTGHSGAGKTTLLRVIGGLERCTEGQLVVAGQNVGRMSAQTIPHYRRRVGLVFQDHRLLPDRTVFDNVALPLILGGASGRDITPRVRAALARVGLEHRELTSPATLSTGEQQRVGIARAVVSRPPILLADEPTGNLDPALSREVIALFSDFHRLGTTVVIATHDRDLLTVAHARILELHEGRCVE